MAMMLQHKVRISYFVLFPVTSPSPPPTTTTKTASATSINRGTGNVIAKFVAQQAHILIMIMLAIIILLLLTILALVAYVIHKGRRTQQVKNVVKTMNYGKETASLGNTSARPRTQCTRAGSSTKKWQQWRRQYLR